MKKIIGLYGVPRSGTSWLGEILNSSSELIYKFQPQFSYAFRDRITKDSTYEEMISSFQEMMVSQDDFINRKNERAEGKFPSFNKNPHDIDILAYKEVRFLYDIHNLLENCSQFLLIGIIRNPIDTLNSWINAPKEYKQEWVIEDEWRFAKLKNQNLQENFYGFEKWKEAVKIFNRMKNIYEERVYIIKYEDLVLNPKQETKNLFSFCGIKYEKQTDSFIDDSTTRQVDDAYAVYRNKSSQYERYLSKTIEEEIMKEVREDDILKKYY